MDKKIEDYLHLYLGSKVLINNAKYENRSDTLTYINELGIEYNVHPTTIRLAITGKNWSKVK